MTFAHTTRLQREAGFTLVELAIVMIIIGLLIGGVLKGQELIENARITALVKTVHPLEIAVQTFQSSYGTIPGDLPDPAARLQDCTDDCANYAGNGDTLLSAAHSIWVLYTGHRWAENQIFWYQLAAPGFITGVDARGTQNGTVTRAFGVTSPSTPIAPNGFEVYQPRHTAAEVAPYSAIRGIHLVLKPAPNTIDDWTTVGASGGSLTARQSHQVDSKLDDGRPWSGRVRSINQGGTTGCGAGPTNNDYDDNASEGRNCNVLIKISN